ncbi:MAG: carboxypeptidase regulatory-like domain-containing protein [Granulicella sp.]
MKPTLAGVRNKLRAFPGAYALRSSWVAVGFMLAACLPIIGQVTTGSIVGVVYDPSGAVIDNCAVMATDIETGAIREVQTNESGYYVIPSLTPHPYKLTATITGFAVTTTQITVTLGQTAHFDFHLTASAVSQNVQVTAFASALELNTSSHQVDSLISSRSIENLPAAGRDVFQTLQSLPNVSPFQNAAGPVSNFRTATNSVTIGGSAAGTTSYLQDGVTNIAMLTKTANFQPPIEATQEVSIIQNGASARFDEPSVVNVITKSGTNRFHGRVYDYFQNDALNTIGYFKKPKPPLRYNQFGANIGGPILKNKLFFFFDYAGLRNTTGTTLYAVVPTPAERKGDFSQDAFTIYDPATYNQQAGTIAAFPGNIIPSGRISNFANQYMAYFPLPTGSSVAGNNFQQNVSNTNTHNSYLGRLDYTIGSQDSLYGAYESTNPSILNPSFSASPIFTYVNTQTAKNAFSQETHTFNSSTINIARFAYNESNINYAFTGKDNYVKLFGLQNLNPQPNQFQPPQVSLNRHTGLGNAASPQGALQRLFEFSDEVNLTRGKHNVYAGVGLNKLNMDGYWGIWNNGQYTFNGQFTSNHATKLIGGSDLADLLLGFPSSAEGGTGVTAAKFRQWNVFPYIQDDWRISSKLTLNLGLRYDYYGAPADADGHSNIYDLPTNTNHPGTYHQQYLNFAPRAGFAYAVGGAIAVHGGYGIYYSPFQYNQLQFMMINQPNFNLQLNTYSLASPTPVTNTFVANPTLSAQAPFTIQLDIKTPYVQQWNLAIQRSIGPQWLATIAYLGNKSTHLQIRQNPNQASLPTDPANPSPIQSRRPYSYVGDVFQISGIGYGNYNSLVAELKRNFSNGLSLSANYVRSKSLDALNNGAATPQYGPNVQAEYGLSDFNANNVFKTSGIYQLPFGTGRRFLGQNNIFNNQVIGGWQFSGILTIQSGLPFTVTANDLSNTGGYHSQRANQVCNGNRPDGQSINYWFNTSCYLQTGVGQFGNQRRDTLIGPRTTNLDMSFFKSFALPEDTSLQFRTDLFDSLNHPLLGSPNASVTSASYGQITNITGNRIVQLALKFIY